MNRIARLLAAAMLTATFAAGPAQATSSLSFEGEGYWIDLEVGDDAQPAIASVRFHAPGDAQGVLLAPGCVTVDAFDATQHVLELHYAGGDGVAPFSLSVQGAEAVLETGTTRVAAAFDWAQ